MNIFNQSTLNIKYVFDTESLRRGDYSSHYFLKTRKILEKQEPKKSVLQFSILNDGEFVVAGIGESISLLKSVLPNEIFQTLKIYGRQDGDIIQGKTGLLYIEGEYKDICIFENIIDGILNKRIGIATKAYQLTQLIDKDQKIIYMADRTEDYWSQNGNGLAAYIGGIRLFSTEKSIEYIRQIDKNMQPVGTMPHALIQQFNGSVLDATKAFIETFKDQGVVALLDYNNDVIQSLNELLPVLNNIHGVRLDTSKYLIDHNLMNNSQNNGVNSNLVSIVRKWLNDHNFHNVKILVSSGIDNIKVQALNNSECKPDYFGVGGYFLASTLNITADLISLNGLKQAKVGRFAFIDYEKELFLYKF